MKNILFRSALLVLSLVMVFSMFTACGKQAEPSTDAIVELVGNYTSERIRKILEEK